jgi:large subunit ribosomal protein L2
MGTRKFNPLTPGQRHRVMVTREELTSTHNEPEKSLLETIVDAAGRNSDGKRTMRYRGGGHKRQYRIIDFKRDKDGIEATVKSIEYDPNRTAFIALVNYADGEKRYILAPKGLKVGDKVISGKGAAPENGNALFLSEVPLGAAIHNIEMHPSQGGALVRSAGTSATLMGREGGRYAVIKFPSGETRRILMTCKATMGSVSNPDHSLEVMGKAGRNRWKGVRPRNRGVAMNPVDHPMGGGEGRASGGIPRSRKGLPAKGLKTRDKTKASNKLIISRKNGVLVKK